MKPTDSVSLSHNYNFFVFFSLAVCDWDYWSLLIGIKGLQHSPWESKWHKTCKKLKDSVLNIPEGWPFLQEWNNSNTFVVIGNKILDSLHAYCNHKEVNFYQMRNKCLIIIPQGQ